MKKAALLAAGMTLVVAGVAAAMVFRAGNLILEAEGGLKRCSVKP